MPVSKFSHTLKILRWTKLIQSPPNGPWSVQCFERCGSEPNSTVLLKRTVIVTSSTVHVGVMAWCSDSRAVSRIGPKLSHVSKLDYWESNIFMPCLPKILTHYFCFSFFFCNQSLNFQSVPNSAWMSIQHRRVKLAAKCRSAICNLCTERNLANERCQKLLENCTKSVIVLYGCLLRCHMNTRPHYIPFPFKAQGLFFFPLS